MLNHLNKRLRLVCFTWKPYFLNDFSKCTSGNSWIYLHADNISRWVKIGNALHILQKLVELKFSCVATNWQRWTFLSLSVCDVYQTCLQSYLTFSDIFSINVFYVKRTRFIGNIKQIKSIFSLYFKHLKLVSTCYLNTKVDNNEIMRR